MYIVLNFAGDDKDYAPGPYHVSILAGQLEGLFTITVHNDDVKEKNEYFTVNIDQSSLPCHVTVDNPSEAMVTIKDDDCKYICVVQSMIKGS